MREIISAAFPVSLSNECGCSVFGECNSEGNCECEDGYSGFACSYSNADFLSLTTQIALQITNLEALVGSITDSVILDDLSLLTRTPEAVTLGSANTALGILENIINSSSSSQLKEDAL